MRPDFSKIDYREKGTAPAPAYDPHLEQLQYAAGSAPYLRGPYTTMYITRPWTIRQYAGFLHGGRIERVLQAGAMAGGRTDGTFSGFRSGYASRV
jgi:methylmalonyl-CoA mutase N-terminal domain/subunit